MGRKDILYIIVCPIHVSRAQVLKVTIYQKKGNNKGENIKSWGDTLDSV